MRCLDVWMALPHSSLGSNHPRVYLRPPGATHLRKHLNIYPFKRPLPEPTCCLRQWPQPEIILLCAAAVNVSIANINYTHTPVNVSIANINYTHTHTHACSCVLWHTSGEIGVDSVLDILQIFPELIFPLHGLCSVSLPRMCTQQELSRNNCNTGSYNTTVINSHSKPEPVCFADVGETPAASMWRLETNHGLTFSLPVESRTTAALR